MATESELIARITSRARADLGDLPAPLGEAAIRQAEARLGFNAGARA